MTPMKQMDSNFEETAVRETVEELGIDKNEIEVIGELGTLFGRFGSNYTCFYR